MARKESPLEKAAMRWWKRPIPREGDPAHKWIVDLDEACAAHAKRKRGKK